MSAEQLHFAQTSEDHREILARVKKHPNGFGHRGIDGKDNNSGPCQLASSPEAALCEAVTNSLDATIGRYEADLRARGITKVHDATIAIRDVGVPVCIYASGANGNLTLNIGDGGCGMDSNGMIHGILAQGSNLKPANSILHGNYGMGGLTNFGKSILTVIVTRAIGADGYLWTVVWRENINGTYSYRYAVDGKGDLFYVPVSDIRLVLPMQNGQVVTNPFVAGSDVERVKPQIVLAADKTTRAVGAVFGRLNNQIGTMRTLFNQTIPLLPEFGTVRRQLGFQMNYYAGRDNAHTVYYALTDRMFGSNAAYTVFASDHPSDMTRLKNVAQRFCRRVVLDGMFDPTSAPKARGSVMAISTAMNYTPLWRLPVTVLPIKVRDDEGKRQEVDAEVRMWVLDNGGLDSDGSTKTPVGYFLTGKKNSRNGLFITSNGQTHSRLSTVQLLRDAGYPYLAGNLIIEVAIDDPSTNRPFIFKSDRESLIEEFNATLRAELVAFLKGCADDLTKWNDHFTTKKTSPTDPDTQARINAFLDNPIFGDMTGIGGASRKTYGPSEGKDRPTPGTNPAPKTYILRDPPTMLDLPNTMTVKPSKSKPSLDWLTIRTDAKNPVYGKPSHCSITTSDPRVVVNTRTGMTEGKFRVKVESSLADGESVTITATIKAKGVFLSKTCTVTAVDVQRKDRDLANRRQRGNRPEFHVEGVPTGDPNLNGWCFNFVRTADAITIYYDEDFGPLKRAKMAVETEKDNGAEDTIDAFKEYLISTTAVLITDPSKSFEYGLSSDDDEDTRIKSVVAAGMHGWCIHHAVSNTEAKSKRRRSKTVIAQDEAA